MFFQKLNYLLVSPKWLCHIIKIRKNTKKSLRAKLIMVMKVSISMLSWPIITVSQSSLCLMPCGQAILPDWVKICFILAVNYSNSQELIIPSSAYIKSIIRVADQAFVGDAP